MGNDIDTVKRIPALLKERLGQAVTPVQKPIMLHGQWKSVLKGYMGIPDEPHITFEFYGDGTWSDGEGHYTLEWRLKKDNLLILQYCYISMSQSDDSGVFDEEGYYVYSTKSGKLVFSNADTSVLIELTKKKNEYIRNARAV